MPYIIPRELWATEPYSLSKEYHKNVSVGQKKGHEGELSLDPPVPNAKQHY